ncbi:MAG: insulinase family protein [Bacteroidetes bacterium]|nr:insulinase family protein [Bacteroidota bacterium]
MVNTKLNLFLIALLLTIVSFAQTPVKQKKQLGNATPISDLKQSNLNYEYAINDPLKTRIYTLKNGLKVYLSVYKDAPRIQTLIAVKAGSKNDPSDATGLAHYLEHMVFKGTDTYGTKDFKKEEVEIKKIEGLYEVYRETKDEAKRKIIYHAIDSVSGIAAKYAIANEYDKMLATIGADGTNAFTSFDQTVYVNDIPSNQISTWLKIESERFRKPVLRLFHTELEAVYEEKNRSLDNDNDKVYDALMSSLFKKHTYGTQTTIGTIEHLKNPSLIEINKFYNKYYVPNNMAIIMSGDFDPDKVIVDIEKNFGSYSSKPVDSYDFKPEDPITSKIVKTVVGPDPANVNLGFRVGGEGTPDADVGELMASILYNGTAGLMDINLNQAQKVLTSNNIFYVLSDYTLFGFSGEPKQGQSLEEVEQLLLGQIELVKKGEFPDWLLQAVITDMKLKKTKDLEQNYSRANEMLDAFIGNIKWQKAVDRIERISKITKKEIVDFANKNFTNSNYVVVYKRTGENVPSEKVVKPAITPIEVDRDNSSKFVKDINNSVPAKIEPKFLDFEKDIQKSTLKANIPLLYNKNTENKLFELYYEFEMGSNNDKLLPIVVKYIPYLATEGMDAAKIKQEFYKLGCTFNVHSGDENTWISLVGLNDNFEKALKLFEKILDKPVVDDKVLKTLIADIIKSRNDQKLQKAVILNHAMLNYARFGPINPFSNVLSDEEINKISVTDIKNKIKSLTGFEHKVLYYGPNELEEIRSMINSYHHVPEKLTAISPSYNFVERTMDKTVYVVDFDMTQVEILMLSNGAKYDSAKVPIIALYNNYFGGGMSSIVFQDLRESKALAYSTGSGYRQPNKQGKNYYNSSYIGSQADKLSEAMKGLSDLLNTMPRTEGGFNSSKELILQEMRTQRVTKSDIFFEYITAQNMGNQTDIRKDIYQKIQDYKLEDVEKFQKEYIKGKPTTILVLGKKDGLDMKTLEKYGTVKFLTLKEIFGY